MAAKKKTETKKGARARLKVLFLGVTLALLLATGFFVTTWGRIHQGVYIAGVAVGGKTPEETIALLTSEVKKPEEIKLKHQSEPFDQEFSIKTADISLEYDFQKSADRAYKIGRSGNPFFDLKQIFESLTTTKKIGLSVKLAEDELAKYLSTIAGQVALEPIYPSVRIENGGVLIDQGKLGVVVDLLQLRVEVGLALSQAESQTLTISKEIVDPSLTAEEMENLKGRAQKLVAKNLNLTFEFQNFAFGDQELVQFLAKDGFNQVVLEKEIKDISASVNRKAQNPTFVFEGGRVREFAPAKSGVATKKEELKKELENALVLLEGETKTQTLAIPFAETPSEIQTHEVNNLGIKELIGRGQSRFRGSIASRIYNINLAATRLNGVLIKPGEIFSFNSALGDVSKLTGYKEAYVIQNGQTVLGDGGGICQVSTTLFRAALDAGLPIAERRAHSYRVGYYEQDIGVPGLDATVYSPVTDLKFENNTPGHILVQAYPDTQNTSLVFELYGTNDGRVATHEKPVVWDNAAPPAPLYIDDPNLPQGVVKQIDFAAWGAKSRFDYKVTRDGEVIYEKTFYSTYRPWQAKFLRGVGPVN